MKGFPMATNLDQNLVQEVSSEDENKAFVLKIASEEEYQTKVVRSSIPVIVDFWAEWCGPCKSLEPILEEIAKEQKGKILVCKVNVEDNPQLAASYNIRNIPFLAFIKNGQKVNELVGNQPKQVILNQIDALK
jgi:thioredoxin 1